MIARQRAGVSSVGRTFRPHVILPSSSVDAIARAFISWSYGFDGGVPVAYKLKYIPTFRRRRR